MIERSEIKIGSGNKKSFVSVFDAYVYKQVVHKGAEKRVHDDSTVNLELVIRTEPYLDDNRSFVIASYIETKSLSTRVSDLMPVGLRLAVRSMCEAEVCVAWVHHDFGFGADKVSTDEFGSDETAIPSSSNLLMEIRVTRIFLDEPAASIERAFNPQKCRDERLEDIQGLIEKGHNHQAEDESLMALKLFSNALFRLRRLKVDAEKNPEDEKLRLYLVFSMAKRASQLSLRVSQFARAVYLVRQALELQPEDNEVKFTQGCAYYALGKYEIARSILQSPRFADVANPRYKEKLDEINDHIRLAGREEYEYEDDEDEAEKYAESVLKKLDGRMMSKAVRNFLLEHLRTKPQTLEVVGGFPSGTLSSIALKLNNTMTHHTSIRAVMRNGGMTVFSTGHEDIES